MPGGSLPLQKTPDPFPSQPDAWQAIPFDELYLFLTALAELEQESGFIGALEYAMQRAELERLKS